MTREGRHESFAQRFQPTEPSSRPSSSSTEADLREILRRFNEQEFMRYLRTHRPQPTTSEYLATFYALKVSGRLESEGRFEDANAVLASVLKALQTEERGERER